MRRIDDTYRVFGLVSVAVVAGLSVAGMSNGSADAHGMARAARQQERPASDAQAAGPARIVRVVYGGSFGGQPVMGTAERTAKPVPSGSTPAGADVVARPGSSESITRPQEAAVQLASRKESLSNPATAETRAGSAKPGIDLNSASVEELNALGGGRIGKAIARSRPYSTREDLLAKRVINRATYARISSQVTVR